MTDVVAAIEARLGEMEAVARGVALGPWEWGAEDGLNDPAAVLRMVAGLRAIVALHRPVDYSSLGMESPNACELCGIDAAPIPSRSSRDSWPCPTLLAIAAMFPATPAAASEGGAG